MPLVVLVPEIARELLQGGGEGRKVEVTQAQVHVVKIAREPHSGVLRAGNVCTKVTEAAPKAKDLVDQAAVNELAAERRDLGQESEWGGVR
jgi:hypothetical protein